MKHLRAIFRSFLRKYYEDKLAEISLNRAYLVAQSNGTHRYLDAEQERYQDKIRELEK